MKSKFLKRMLQLMLAGLVLIVIATVMNPDLWRLEEAVISKEGMRSFLNRGKDELQRDSFSYALTEQKISTIEISVSNADLKITETDGDLMSGELYAGSSTSLQHEVVGDMLKIEAVHRRKWSFGFFNWISDRELNISVPKGYALDIRVRGVSGDVDVALSEVKGFQAETVSGEIHGRLGRAESVRTTTTSGMTDVKVSSGTLDAEMTSISGEIELEAENVDQLVAETTSGDIEIRATETLIRSEGIVTSISGDIELRGVPKDLGLDLRTISGELSVWDMTAEKTVSRSGEGMLRAETTSGSITVK